MPAKAKRSFRRKFIKISLVIIAVFIFCFSLLYIWFVHNSKALLIDLFNERSSGKLKLELADVRFNFISDEVKISKAKIISTNKGNPRITYQVSFLQITLHTNSIWSLLLTQKLQIKQIKAYDPVIEVYNNHKGIQRDSTNTLSIGMELGKIYNSIQDGITALHTHSIYIINATLILNNKADSAEKRIVFSNIYFTLKKLHKFNKASGGYVENNTLDFSSSNQAITLSDGIHQLLFKKLSIKQARSIVLDSCTLIALPTHSSGGNYTIKFKKLALVGVDFHSLYRDKLIKADSVYCENPIADIRIATRVADSNIAVKGLPDLEKIIKVFSGNLDLGFVGVMNADIHLDIKGRKALSNIHSGKVNFQMKNLRINPDSTQLISMSSFDMMVKGYQLYNSDSTCVYSFDSVRFGNDKLVLNNVSVRTSSANGRIRNFRDYTIPYFELTGINWPELIFRQNLKATEAILDKPTINFIKNKNFTVSKNSILGNSHRTFDDFIEIEKLKIINGIINIKWGVNNSLQLMGLNLGVLGDNIADYKHLRLNEDIESLVFNSGLLKIGDITAQLQQVIFNANNEIHAGELLIENKKTGIDSKISDVSINNIYSKKNSGDMVVNGLKWNHGVINLNAVNGVNGKHKPASILLNDVEGKQTRFQIKRGDLQVSAFVNNLKIASFEKNNEKPVTVKGLRLKGAGMDISNASLKIKAAAFMVSDESQEFDDVIFGNNGSTQHLSITIPHLNIKDDISDFLSNNFHFKNIELQSPVIDFQKQNTSIPVIPKKPFTIPAVVIDHLAMFEPSVNVKLQDTSGINLILPSSRSGKINMDSIQLGPLGFEAGGIHIQNEKVQVINGTDSLLDVDNGIDAGLANVNISASADKSWEALLVKLSAKNSHGFSFNIKGNEFWLKDVGAGNISVTSSTIKSIAKLSDANPRGWITTSSTKYTTKAATFRTGQISYNENGKILLIDSINYHPILSRDSAISLNPYQMDYIFFNAGSAGFSGIDLVKTLSDNSIVLQKAVFDHPSINVYRDKLPPFLEGTRKQLFTEMIKKISLPVSVNTVDFNEGEVSYIEKNSKSRLEGNVTLTHLNGNVINFKNNQIREGDSLLISFSGRLADKIYFDLQLHQSYVDPLYGFLLDLTMQPASLNVLNPLLVPLSDVRFVSGNMDKMEMRVAGNENAAHGEMKFYYHKLRIQLLKNGGITKRKFIKGAESDLVNFFFLKNNNTSRTGLVYFERLKDRSFFNYINKIVFSGVSTSVGARKNSKYRKLSRKNNLSVFK